MNAAMHGATVDTDAVAEVAEAQRLEAWPSRPPAASWWQTCQSRDVLVERLLALFTDPDAVRARDKTRRHGLTKVLDWLVRQPGDTWQDRWLASGAEAAGFDWTDLVLHGHAQVRPHHRDC